jgi:hypothetical protein
VVRDHAKGYGLARGEFEILIDCTNSLDIQPLAFFTIYHAFQHAVHIADGRSEDVDAGSGDELPGFLWCSEVPGLAR